MAEIMRSKALASFLSLLAEARWQGRRARTEEVDGFNRFCEMLEMIGPVPVPEWVAAIDQYQRDPDVLLGAVRNALRNAGQLSLAEVAGLAEDLRTSSVELVRKAGQEADLSARTTKADLIDQLIAHFEDRDEDSGEKELPLATESGTEMEWFRAVAFSLAEAMTGPNRRALKRVFLLLDRYGGAGGLAGRIEAAFAHDPGSLAAIVFRFKRRDEPETMLGEIVPDLTSAQLSELCAWAGETKSGGRDALLARVTAAYRVPPRDEETAVWMASYLLREIEEDVFVKEEWAKTRNRIATGLGRFSSATLQKLAEEAGLRVRNQKASQLEEFRKHLKSLSISRSRTAHVA